MNVHKVSTRIGDRDLTIETGKLAKQADGAVIVSYGDTVVLVTACSNQEPRENVDFPWPAELSAQRTTKPSAILLEMDDVDTDGSSMESQTAGSRFLLLLRPRHAVIISPDPPQLSPPEIAVTPMTQPSVYRSRIRPNITRGSE